MADEKPTNPISAFGQELRAYRSREGMRLEDLSPRLHLSPSMIGKIENGTRVASHNLAMACDRIFSAPGTFLRLWRMSAERAVPSWFSPYFELESIATRIHKWELRCIPGLLQTPDYARAVMRTGLPREADDIIEENVNLRIDRQAILTKEFPPVTWFIIDESVLHRPFGGEYVMRKQVKRLTEFADLPNVVIQVMPFTATDHPGMYGPLTVLEFDDSSPIGYAEGWGSGRLIENSTEVRNCLTCYDVIRASALSASASLDLIKRSEGQNEVG